MWRIHKKIEYIKLIFLLTSVITILLCSERELRFHFFQLFDDFWTVHYGIYFVRIKMQFFAIKMFVQSICEQQVALVYWRINQMNKIFSENMFLQYQPWKNLKIGRRTRFSGLKWSARERKMSARTTYFPMFFYKVFL